MHLLGDVSLLERQLEILPPDAALQSRVEVALEQSIEHIPHFRLWLAAELPGHRRWRMHLQREPLLRIQNF
jgi:hypothetical protein